MKLANNIAIITGGGGSIGLAIAKKLSSEGASVVLTDINLATAEKGAGEIRASGGKAMAIAMDVTNPEEIKQMTEAVLARFGQIDILVNNAGGSAREKSALFHQSKREVLDWILDVNLKGPLYCTRAVVEQMIKQGSGKIINITSIVALQGMRGLTDYATAKGGIIAFTKSLAMEVGEHGINVNCVSPGKVPRNEVSEDFAARYSYLHKVCKPENVADLVGFLSSEEASYITGQNYVIDGGRSLGLKGD